LFARCDESPELSRRSGEVHVHVYPESLLTDLYICPRDHRSIFIRRLDEPVAFKPLLAVESPLPQTEPFPLDQDLRVPGQRDALIHSLTQHWPFSTSRKRQTPTRQSHQRTSLDISRTQFSLGHTHTTSAHKRALQSPSHVPLYSHRGRDSRCLRFRRSSNHHTRCWSLDTCWADYRDMDRRRKSTEVDAVEVGHSAVDCRRQRGN
jgi:hypothetical protein